MKILLDTNICVAYLNGKDRGVRTRLLSFSPDEVGLCSVVKAELIYGARYSSRVDENLQRLNTFFAPFESLYFDDKAAAYYGLIRAQLRREGTPIGANDMMIAAIALAEELEVITRDEGDFIRVPGLRVSTW